MNLILKSPDPLARPLGSRGGGLCAQSFLQFPAVDSVELLSYVKLFPESNVEMAEWHSVNVVRNLQSLTTRHEYSVKKVLSYLQDDH